MDGSARALHLEQGPAIAGSGSIGFKKARVRVKSTVPKEGWWTMGLYVRDGPLRDALGPPVLLQV
jgi:hypothetical protein